MKFAKVVPVPKVNNENNSNNFRPISVLPMFSKIFESLIKERLVSYFDKNNLFVENQFGYRQGKSTLKAIITNLEVILDAIDKKQIPCISLLDLSKAFDCVQHSNLINKLEFYGIRGGSLNLFKSYFNNRMQVVSLPTGEISKALPIKNGVPQGSILGPIFFLIYINDFSSHIRTKLVTLYADDTTFISVGNSVENVSYDANVAVSDAEVWFESNCLKLNENKSERVIFKRIPGSEAKHAKLLGVHIDDKLNWHFHIHFLAKKLNKVIFQIRKLIELTTLETAITFYYSNFLSVVNSSLLLWGCSREAERIFKIQKKVVRLLCMASSKEHCKPLFRKLNLFTIPSYFIYHCLLYVYENKKVTNSNFHLYNTRLKNDLSITYHRLNRTQQSINHICLKLYNKLPNNMKLLCLNAFKRVIKHILLQETFYHYSEFLDCDLSKYVC